MSLTILSDDAIKKLLASLSREDVRSLLATFSDAMHSYSLGNESQYQVERQGITRPGEATMLFMPASLPGSCSVKVVGVPSPQHAGLQAKPIQGAIMVFDNDGRAQGLINAAETTAFRTSLGSILLYQHRETTKHIVVFGAGKQALWHLRLALILRGEDIETITIVNRSAERAEELIQKLKNAGTNATFSVLAGSPNADVDYTDRLRTSITQADVIFCTTPSTETLFPAEWITGATDKARFISAIGSYKLNMGELDPQLFQAVVGSAGQESGIPGPAYSAASKSISNGQSSVVVDSREACAMEAGELVKAQIGHESIMELGEVTEVERNGRDVEKAALSDWLKRGLVVYKSVGIGIMDLAISKALLELAPKHGLGVSLDAF